MTTNENPTAHRPLHIIATEISRDWGSKGAGVSYTAQPYLSAMRYLDTMSDSYFEDSARSVVNYFLSNASGWRGETAKRVKAELRAMLAAR